MFSAERESLDSLVLAFAQSILQEDDAGLSKSAGAALETPSPSSAVLSQLHSIDSVKLVWPTDFRTLQSTEVSRSLVPLISLLREQTVLVELGQQNDGALAGCIGTNADAANRPRSLLLAGTHVLLAPRSHVFKLLTVTCCGCGNSLLRTGARDWVLDNAVGAFGLGPLPTSLFESEDYLAIDAAFWATASVEAREAWVDEFGEPRVGDLERESGQAAPPTLDPPSRTSTVLSEDGSSVHKRHRTVCVEPLDPAPETLHSGSSVAGCYAALDTGDLKKAAALLVAHLSAATASRQRHISARLPDVAALGVAEKGESAAQATLKSLEARQKHGGSELQKHAAVARRALEVAKAKVEACRKATNPEVAERDRLRCEKAAAALLRVRLHLGRISRNVRCRTPVGLHRMARQCRAAVRDLELHIQAHAATRDADTRGEHFSLPALLRQLERARRVSGDMDRALGKVMGRYAVVLGERRVEQIDRYAEEVRLETVASCNRRFVEAAARRERHRAALEASVGTEVAFCRWLVLARRELGGSLSALRHVDFRPLLAKSLAARAALAALDRDSHRAPVEPGDEELLAGVDWSTAPSAASLDQARREIAHAVQECRRKSPLARPHAQGVTPAPPGPTSLDDDCDRVINVLQKGVSSISGLRSGTAEVKPSDHPVATCSLLRGGCGMHNFQWKDPGRASSPGFMFSPQHPQFVCTQVADEDLLCSGRTASLGYVHEILGSIWPEDAARYGIAHPEAAIKSVLSLWPLSLWLPAVARRLSAGALAPATRVSQMSLFSRSCATVATLVGRWSRLAGRAVLASDRCRFKFPLLVRSGFGGDRASVREPNPDERALRGAEQMIQSHAVTLLRDGEAARPPRGDVVAPGSSPLARDVTRSAEEALGTLVPELPLATVKHDLRRIHSTAVSAGETLKATVDTTSLSRRHNGSGREVIVNESNVPLHVSTACPNVLARSQVTVRVTRFNLRAVRRMAARDSDLAAFRAKACAAAARARLSGVSVTGVLAPLVTASALRSEAPASILRSLREVGGETDTRLHLRGGAPAVQPLRLVEDAVLLVTASAGTVANSKRYPILLQESLHAQVLLPVPAEVFAGAGLGGPSPEKQPKEGDFDGDTEEYQICDGAVASFLAAGAHLSTQSDQASGSLIQPSHDGILALSWASRPDVTGRAREAARWASLMGLGRAFRGADWASLSPAGISVRVGRALRRTAQAGGLPEMTGVTLALPQGVVYPQRRLDDVAAEAATAASATVSGGVVTGSGVWDKRMAATDTTSLVKTVANDFTSAVALRTVERLTQFGELAIDTATPGIHAGMLLLGHRSRTESDLLVPAPHHPPPPPRRRRRAFRTPWARPAPGGTQVTVAAPAPPAVVFATLRRAVLESRRAIDLAELAAHAAWRERAGDHFEQREGVVLSHGGSKDTGYLGDVRRLHLQANLEAADGARLLRATEGFTQAMEAQIEAYASEAGLDPAQSVMFGAVLSGAKGNLSKLASCVGSVGGGMRGGAFLPRHVGGRVSFFHAKNAPLTPEAVGFTRRAFTEGLGPAALALHAVAAVPLVAAASVSVFEGGVLQNNLSRSLDDHTLEAAGVMVDAGGDVFTLMHDGNAGRMDVVVTSPVDELGPVRSPAAAGRWDAAVQKRRLAGGAAVVRDPYLTAEAKLYVRASGVYGDSPRSPSAFAQACEAAAVSRLATTAAQTLPLPLRTLPLSVPHLLALVRANRLGGGDTVVVGESEVRSGLARLFGRFVEVTYQNHAPRVVEASLQVPPPPWLWARFFSQNRRLVEYLLESCHPHQISRVLRLRSAEWKEFLNCALDYFRSSRVDRGSRSNTPSSASNQNTQQILRTKHGKIDENARLFSQVLALTSKPSFFYVEFSLQELTPEARRRHPAAPRVGATAAELSGYVVAPEVEEMFAFRGVTRGRYAQHPLVVAAGDLARADVEFEDLGAYLAGPGGESRAFVDRGGASLPCHVLSLKRAAHVAVDFDDMHRISGGNAASAESLLGLVVGRFLEATTASQLVTCVRDGSGSQDKPVYHFFVRTLFVYDLETSDLGPGVPYELLPAAEKRWRAESGDAEGLLDPFSLEPDQAQLVAWLRVRRAEFLKATWAQHPKKWQQAFIARAAASAEAGARSSPGVEAVTGGVVESVSGDAPPLPQEEASKLTSSFSKTKKRKRQRSQEGESEGCRLDKRARKKLKAEKRRVRREEGREVALEMLAQLDSDTEGEVAHDVDEVCEVDVDEGEDSMVLSSPPPPDGPAAVPSKASRRYAADLASDIVAAAFGGKVSGEEVNGDETEGGGLALPRAHSDFAVPVYRQVVATGAGRSPLLPPKKHAPPPPFRLMPSQVEVEMWLESTARVLCEEVRWTSIFVKIEATGSPGVYRGFLRHTADGAQVLAAVLQLEWVRASSVRWPTVQSVVDVFGHGGGRVHTHAAMSRVVDGMGGALREEHVDTIVDRLCRGARPRPIGKKRDVGGVLSRISCTRPGDVLQAGGLRKETSHEGSVLAAMVLGRVPKGSVELKEN
jgi:hypothetical protein